MPSWRRRPSLATLKAFFKSNDKINGSDGSSDPDLDSERVRRVSRSVPSLSRRHSDTPPDPETVGPTAPYKIRSNDVPISTSPSPFPSPISHTVASPDSFTSDSQAPSSSYGVSPTLTASSPQPQPFSPFFNLHADTLHQVEAGPKTNKGEKLLNEVEDVADSTNDPNSLINAEISTLKTLLDSTGGLKAIETEVNSFEDSIPWLMKGLDEVVKMHPFVGVAVLAFKAAYKMDMARRENDKRIRSLYVEMKEMIAVLIQFKQLKQLNDVDFEGKPIMDRLQKLCETAAVNIRECANTCDSYTKKRLVVKVLKGLSWETKLVSFIGIFTRRKAEFLQALAIHNARTVDEIQSISSRTQVIVAALDDKMAQFLKMFAVNIPTLELAMLSKVREKGDLSTVLKSDVALKELNDFENEIRPQQGSNAKGGERFKLEFTMKDLKDELYENMDAAINSNFEGFERKFLLHQDQLQEQLAKSVKDVISTVREGPHDKIKNSELKNWRRNVKASLFVMTLRDHFREQGEENKENEALQDWTLKYIDTTWLQSIMEAFDDDASGYITVTELNRFTDACPVNLKWSLPQWIAYWAIGWQLTTQKYKNQIEETMDKMFSSVKFSLPENRNRVEHYLSLVWRCISQIIQGLQYPNEVSEHLVDKFTAYVEHEEGRLRKNLESIKYNVDAIDAVHIVAGGKIEKHILPIAHLLLSRHLEIFKVAQTKVLHNDELSNAANSLVTLTDAAVHRVRDLTELFQQRKLNIPLQFKKFAFGMFDYLNDSDPLWSMSKLKEPSPAYREYTLEELTAEPKSDEEEVLYYGIKTTTAFATKVFDGPALQDASDIPELEESNLVKELQGTWCGYRYTETEYPAGTMDTFHFNPDSASNSTFAHTYTEANGLDSGPFKLTGSCSKDEDGMLKVAWKIDFAAGKGTLYFTGHLDGQSSIVGYSSWSEDVSKANHDSLFICRRIPAEIMAIRPSPLELEDKKYRALWQFAIKYAKREFHKNAWSWSYFAERRRIRERYINLNIRHWWYGRPLTTEERVEFLECRKALTTEEASFYRGIRDYVLTIMPKHHGIYCDGCDYHFGGPRYICLDCVTPEQVFWDTCDLCDLSCFDKLIDRGESKTHRPNHDMMKLRTVLTEHDMPAYYQSAWESLTKARALFRDSTRTEVTTDTQLGHQVSSTGAEVLLPTTNGKAREEFLANSNGKEGASVDETQVLTSASATPHGFVDSPDATATLAKLEVDVGSPTIRLVDEPEDESLNHTGTCIECFICDYCEEKTLLSCVTCFELYVQPSWYYGSNPKDNFQCNVCNAKKLVPTDLYRDVQHVYTHPLVRCKPFIADPPGSSDPTTEERITSLERKTTEMDTKIDHLVEKFTKVEKNVEKTMEMLATRLPDG
ncbi:hypothetical protein EIP91_009662, partial [Steccherinum ochraceum]